jgi:transcription antitermination factor NusG
MTNWYALQSKPNKEEVVWQQVTAQGYESFYPRLPIRPVNPRARKTKPYFPGYLFVRVDLDKVGHTIFQWLPDGVGLVSFDGNPAPVEDLLINGVRDHVDEIVRKGGLAYYGLKPGDEVAIRSGPFAGYRAIFDTDLPGKDRVRVLLRLLGERATPLELDAVHVKPRY